MHISWQKINNNANNTKKWQQKVHGEKKYRTIKQISAWHHFGYHTLWKKNRKYSIKYSNRAYTDKLPCLCEQLGVCYVKHKPWGFSKYTFEKNNLIIYNSHW